MGSVGQTCQGVIGVGGRKGRGRSCQRGPGPHPPAFRVSADRKHDEGRIVPPRGGSGAFRGRGGSHGVAPCGGRVPAAPRARRRCGVPERVFAPRAAGAHCSRRSRPAAARDGCGGGRRRVRHLRRRAHAHRPRPAVPALRHREDDPQGPRRRRREEGSRPGPGRQARRCPAGTGRVSHAGRGPAHRRGPAKAGRQDPADGQGHRGRPRAAGRAEARPARRACHGAQAQGRHRRRRGRGGAQGRRQGRRRARTQAAQGRQGGGRLVRREHRRRGRQGGRCGQGSRRQGQGRGREAGCSRGGGHPHGVRRGRPSGQGSQGRGHVRRREAEQAGRRRRRQERCRGRRSPQERRGRPREGQGRPAPPGARLPGAPGKGRRRPFGPEHPDRPSAPLLRFRRLHLRRPERPLRRQDEGRPPARICGRPVPRLGFPHRVRTGEERQGDDSGLRPRHRRRGASLRRHAPQHVLELGVHSADRSRHHFAAGQRCQELPMPRRRSPRAPVRGLRAGGLVSTAATTSTSSTRGLRAGTSASLLRCTFPGPPIDRVPRNPHHHDGRDAHLDDDARSGGFGCPHALQAVDHAGPRGPRDASLRLPGGSASPCRGASVRARRRPPLHHRHGRLLVLVLGQGWRHARGRPVGVRGPGAHEPEREEPSRPRRGRVRGGSRCRRRSALWQATFGDRRADNCAHAGRLPRIQHGLLLQEDREGRIVLHWRCFRLPPIPCAQGIHQNQLGCGGRGLQQKAGPRRGRQGLGQGCRNRVRIAHQVAYAPRAVRGWLHGRILPRLPRWLKKLVPMLLCKGKRDRIGRIRRGGNSRHSVMIGPASGRHEHDSGLAADMKQAVRPLNRLIWRPAASPAALNGRHGAARAFSATRPTLRTDDLSGILVVSIDQAVAAPYCAMRLADMGARVIKVERPDGDFARKYDKFVKDQSAYFLWLNRGKESIALDFKNPDDMAVLKNMISKADVFIQNLAPGATKRMGLGSAELRKQFPRLITCDISGYGEDGPYRDLKAYDMLIQAETGLATITGAPEGGPARAGISICDISAGVTSLTAILQALYARDVRTGKGRGIEVSLFHSLADWMNAPYLQYAYGGYTPARAGLHHPTIAPYGSYACGDGKSVLIAVQNEREWVSLCSNVFKRPEMAIDERFKSMVNRVANRPALDEIILEIMAWFPREHWCAELEKAKIAYGRLSSMEDLKNHPQAKFMTVKSTEGNVEVKMMTPGALLKGITEDGADGKEVLDFGPVPALNEHGAKIRSEFS